MAEMAEMAEMAVGMLPFLNQKCPKACLRGFIVLSY